MSFGSFLPLKGLRAHVAVEQLQLNSVNEGVGLQLSISAKWLVALWTIVPLPSVNEGVGLQTNILAEWFVALWTNVPLANVDLPVKVKATSSRKSLGTLVTRHSICHHLFQLLFLALSPHDCKGHCEQKWQHMVTFPFSNKGWLRLNRIVSIWDGPEEMEKSNVRIVYPTSSHSGQGPGPRYFSLPIEALIVAHLCIMSESCWWQMFKFSHLKHGKRRESFCFLPLYSLNWLLKYTSKV